MEKRRRGEKEEWRGGVRKGGKGRGERRKKEVMGKGREKVP